MTSIWGMPPVKRADMMHAFDEMKAYVDFGPEDEVRLRAFWPKLAPHADAIVDHFYVKVRQSPGARSVLESDAQTNRLMCTLRTWLEEVLNGPWDVDYFRRRERIGHRHVEVGLHSQYMSTAMNVVMQDVQRVAWDVLPREDVGPVLESVQRALHLDLAIMTGTFVEGREERQLATLQELLVRHLRIVVLLVSHDGRIASATRPTRELFGRDEVLGRPWTEAVPPGLVERGNLVERIERMRATGREVSLSRVDVEENGHTRSFRVHLVPLEHPMASFLLQIEELTDAVDLEARLRRNEALAQLGSLSASVAHELRNPLAGISGALQVITRSLPADAPHRHIMEKVEQEVHRLDDLVTDLLAFARPGAACVRPLDLGEAVARAVELVRSDWPGVRFEQIGQASGHADPNVLQQILLNLLQNAAQAVEGRGRVRIDVETDRIRISDDGPGIPEAMRSDIFQPFFTTKTRGTGLGLAISERSARSMDADLRLGRGPLSGASFVLELPQPAE